MKRALVPPHGREPLTPRNQEQFTYLEALQTSSQVFAIGRAGTGKTYIPSAYAANLLLMGNKIDRFVICRPAVACGGERHGFLPGKLEAKVAPWMLPIVDVLEERLGKENVKQLLADETIKAEPFEYMRGRSFKRAFILLDEAQNTTVEQMKMFLTRVGNGSQLVITGDLGQTDMRGENGLSFAVDLIKERGLPVPVIQLKEVERSGICGMWADAFEPQMPRFLMAA